MEEKKTGVYQLENGYWGFRFTLTVNGKRHDVKKTKSEEGQPFKTEKAAARAREAALRREYIRRNGKPTKARMTFGEVFEEYREHGRYGKAYQTIKKQDSLWKNHLCPLFGTRFVDDISVAEVNDYLAHLYYVENRAYRYVESFLKMFYLIFGQAYERDYLDMDSYNKLCVNKSSKISMPKIKVDEDMEIVVFTPEETALLDEYFRGTNAETAYMLGRFCGLRINECYGLKWENIDTERGTITIDRQMLYQEGIIKLVSLKTRNARRTIYMSQQLKEYFIRLKEQRAAWEKEQSEVRMQKQTLLCDVNGQEISSLELVNSLPNGKIQTVNSMKYHSRSIKAKYGLEFKYHYLRHTYGTRLAEMNTPTHILCNQLGHASGKVTERYYLAVSKPGIDILTKNLDAIQ